MIPPGTRRPHPSGNVDIAAVRSTLSPSLWHTGTPLCGMWPQGALLRCCPLLFGDGLRRCSRQPRWPEGVWQQLIHRSLDVTATAFVHQHGVPAKLGHKLPACSTRRRWLAVGEVHARHRDLYKLFVTRAHRFAKSRPLCAYREPVRCVFNVAPSEDGAIFGEHSGADPKLGVRRVRPRLACGHRLCHQRIIVCVITIIVRWSGVRLGATPIFGGGGRRRHHSHGL
mmetsp:Transcript_34113/g.89564  ORF Transcript_34113/g.89564 Transcript_34113/m.89564 type:complete len:226 (-) Transcript_34113:69-746(-)